MAGITGSHSSVGFYPDAVFIRIHLTHAVPAAAAGTITGMFGALGFRTQKGQVLNTAVPAMLTVQQNFFGRILQKRHKLLSTGVVLDPLTDVFQSPGMF